MPCAYTNSTWIGSPSSRGDIFAYRFAKPDLVSDVFLQLVASGGCYVNISSLSIYYCLSFQQKQKDLVVLRSVF